MKDPYSVLGVGQNASDDEIKKAYRELARKYHPDNYQNNPLADLAEEKMKEINEAYDVITKQRSGSYQQPSAGGAYGGYQRQQSYTSSNPAYARIRQLINAGNLNGAEELLRQMPTRNGDAEYYFLAGSIAYRRGWLDEAMQNFTLAVQTDPNNMEYRQALSMVQRGGQAYRPYGQYNNAAECDPCSTYLCISCMTPWGGMCC